jgi:pimeloyl-ACP methyl ester carboxylesterase
VDQLSVQESGPKVQFLSSPEGRIAYEVSGEGPLVVCVPGMGDLRRVYRFVVRDLLESNFRVATMDLRGHGDSDATFSRYDDVATGEDILAVIKHLGGPATIIGNSMGAGAAVWAAAEKPELVESLVLIGPFVRDVPMPAVLKLLFRTALRRPWGRFAWRSYFRTLYPGRKPDGFRKHVAEIDASLSRPDHWKAFVRTTRTSHAPAEARLGDVKARALVVMGEKDPDFPNSAAEAALLGQKLGCDVLLVPQAGHYPQAEYPEVVSPAIIGFLKGGTDA